MVFATLCLEPPPCGARVRFGGWAQRIVIGMVAWARPPALFITVMLRLKFPATGLAHERVIVWPLTAKLIPKGTPEMLTEKPLPLESDTLMVPVSG